MPSRTSIPGFLVRPRNERRHILAGACWDDGRNAWSRSWNARLAAGRRGGVLARERPLKSPRGPDRAFGPEGGFPDRQLDAAPPRPGSLRGAELNTAALCRYTTTLAWPDSGGLSGIRRSRKSLDVSRFPSAKMPQASYIPLLSPTVLLRQRREAKV
jgi:hypothetical protein